MSANYSPWPLSFGGWTTSDFTCRRFANEEELRAALPADHGKKIASFKCEASFKAQPIESGTCPSATGPWSDHRFDFVHTWKEVEEFLSLYGEWPYVDVYADIEDDTHNSKYVTVFYRRVKPSEVE